MSGNDDLLARVRGRLAGQLPETLGIELLEVDRERVRARLAVEPRLCTAGGTLHGGAFMALADTLGAIGTFINLPEGWRTTTVESKTNFLGAAPGGTVVEGEATPVHRGRTTQVWQTRIVSAEGRLLALVLQTQLAIAPKA